jgi:hypothetical protein
MLPSSSFSGAPPPRKKLPSIRLLIPVLATVLLVAGFLGVLVARGAGNTPQLASGPATTATTTSVTDTTTTHDPDWHDNSDWYVRHFHARARSYAVSYLSWQSQPADR